MVENPIRMSLCGKYTEIKRPSSAPNPTIHFETGAETSGSSIEDQPQQISRESLSIETADDEHKIEGIFVTLEESKQLIAFLICFSVVLFVLLVYNMIRYPTFALGMASVTLLFGLVAFLYKWNNRKKRKSKKPKATLLTSINTKWILGRTADFKIVNFSSVLLKQIILFA